MVIKSAFKRVSTCSRVNYLGQINEQNVYYTMITTDKYALRNAASTNNKTQSGNNSLILRGESMEKYKALLDNGWTKEKLNKHIKEQLIQKRLQLHKAQRKEVDNNMKHRQRKAVYVSATDAVSKEHTFPILHDTADTEMLSLPTETALNTSNETIIKLINIDSRFRTNLLHTDSNNFVVALNYTMRNVTRMRLHEIEIPNSWYTISQKKNNNSLAITDHNVFPSVKHTFTIPDGNYDFATLKATTESLISDSGTVFVDLATINININTGKIIIATITDGNTISLHFCESQTLMEAKNEEVDPTQITNTFGWLLGFRKCEYTMSSTHQAESLFDISGTRYIYLCIDDNKTNLNDFVIGNLHTSYLNENVIARITLPNEKYQVINNNTTNIDLKNTQTRFYPQPVKIDRLRIKILDEYGKLLDLNGMDVSLTLEFTLQTEMIPYLN